jgi:chorismate mutase/prephenate dehydratase
MSLGEWRAEIDKVDDELVALLNRRAQLTAALAELKSGAGLPLHDPGREREVVERACRACSPPLDEAAVRTIFACILQESRRMASPLFAEGDARTQGRISQTEPSPPGF